MGSCLDFPTLHSVFSRLRLFRSVTLSFLFLFLYVLNTRCRKRLTPLFHARFSRRWSPREGGTCVGQAGSYLPRCTGWRGGSPRRGRGDRQQETPHIDSRAQTAGSGHTHSPWTSSSGRERASAGGCCSPTVQLPLVHEPRNHATKNTGDNLRQAHSSPRHCSQPEPLLMLLSPLLESATTAPADQNQHACFVDRDAPDPPAVRTLPSPPPPPPRAMHVP